MMGTCWSSSLMTSWINSAARPVSFLPPAAGAFREVIAANTGTATADAAAARVRKERRDGMASSPGARTAVDGSAKASAAGWIFGLRIVSLLLFGQRFLDCGTHS